MALVPHRITALAESDSEGGGKNIVANAVVSMFDLDGNAITLFDDESGSNGSTAKQTDSEGAVVVYLTPGEYDEQVNGGTKRRVLVGDEDFTTEQLIARTRESQDGDVITTTGFATSGDGGGAQWKATATTGLTASQSPADRVAAELVDGSGRLWELVFDGVFAAEAVGGESESLSISLAIDALVYIEGEIFEPTQFGFVLSDTGVVAKKNASNLMLAWEKLSIDSEDISVVCVGDSMTAGHDTSSPDIITSPYGNPVTVAPIQYPISAQTAVRTAAGGSHTFINRGYSGDTAKESFERWTSDPSADVAHIMLGINDSNGVSGATFSEYVVYMQLLIKRYVDWGCGVVLHTATPQQFNGTNPKSAKFTNAIRRIAKEYGCPVFESETTVKYASYDGVYSDNTHFNSHGYNKYGKAVASFILSGGWVGSVKGLSGTQTLATGESSDGYGFWSRSGATLTPDDSSSFLLTGQTGGLTIDSSRVTYSFYMDCEIMDVYAIGSIEGCDVSLSSVLGAQYTGDERGAKSVNRFGVKGYQNLSISETSSYTVLPNRDIPSNGKLAYMGTLYGRGWKIIDVSPNGDPSSTAYLNGIIIEQKSLSQSGGFVDDLTDGVVTVGDSAVITYQFPYYGNEDTTSVPAAAPMPTEINIPCPWGLLPYKARDTHFYDHLPIDITVSNTTSGAWAKCMIKRTGASSLAVETVATGSGGAALVPTGAAFASAEWDNTAQDLTAIDGTSIAGELENIYLKLSFGTTASSFYSITIHDVRKKGQASWM